MLQDGGFHVVDSSELAFRLATIGAFREVYNSAKPVILEPIMTVEVVAPVEFQSEPLLPACLSIMLLNLHVFYRCCHRWPQWT